MPVSTGTFWAGTVTLTTSAVALASRAANLVTIRARTANAGNAYVGITSATTSAAYELAPGEATPPIQLDSGNLTQIFVLGANAGDKVDVLVEG